MYEDQGGEYRWRLRARNGELVADSGEGYSDRAGAEAAVERVRNHAPAADLLPVDGATFEVFEDEGGEYRWRLRARNGELIAASGEGYTERNKAVRAIQGVKRHAPAVEESAGENPDNA